jgi:hypothetical protein
LGRFGLIELLDAQRILFQSPALYVRALANYQQLTNDIERLIARPIDSSMTNKTSFAGPMKPIKIKNYEQSSLMPIVVVVAIGIVLAG